MMLLLHILALAFEFVALCYAQNKFYYSVADDVYPHYMVSQCPVDEKAYFCLATVCLSRWPLCKIVKHSSRLLTFSITYIPYQSGFLKFFFEFLYGLIS